ncbi:MAG: pyoverdine biosynthesis protein PvcB [Halobacteriovoraceae bacterium]|nr:pyoverdine biosynthesis protein PvcB [Halobacteriovoraceae bacterium]|tara:strand:+ start:14882 stop:15688 length:807 start_codon:yes stop_codon:yes gene_type:complete
MKRLSPFGVMIEGNNESIDSLSIQNLKKIFHQEHLIVLRGFKGLESEKKFVAFSESFGEVSLWPFGKVLNLLEQKNPADHIFDHSYIPMHWDGMYRKEVPEMQIFNCVKAPLSNHGGETLFSFTKKIIEDLDAETLMSWEKISFSYKRKMEFYDSKTTAPLICKHQEKNYPVLRYCEPPSQEDGHFKNHPSFEVHGSKTSIVNELKEWIYSPKYCLAHKWKDGDVVLADNFTLLHGRKRFTSGSPRHLQRIQILGTQRIENPHLEYTR